MLFLLLSAFFVLLQWLHLRLLRDILPERAHRYLPWILVALHLPLFAYMGLRFAGWASHGLGPWLQPLARGALYFQAISLLNVLFGYVEAGLYRLVLRHPKEPALELPSRRAFLQGASSAGLGAVAIGAGFGWAQAYGDPQVLRHELFWPDLPPGLDGLRMVQISDLHAGPLASLELLQRWRALTEREHPEILLVTGDFVDSLPEEMAAFSSAFRAFPAPLGRYAILGNHDYFTDPRPLWEELQAQGFRCLENAHTVVNRGGSDLAILGVQDPQALNGRFRGIRFGPGPRPDLAASGLKEGPFRLALAHRPGQWRDVRKAGAQLTLAGHTHGGQVNLVPGLNFARMLGPYTAGLYDEGGQRLYVNRGLGVVGVPMRVAAPPEITVITLRRG
jgi:uncharacterized protein